MTVKIEHLAECFTSAVQQLHVKKLGAFQSIIKRLE